MSTFDYEVIYDLGMEGTTLLIRTPNNTFSLFQEILFKRENKWVPTMEELTGESFIAPEKTKPALFGLGPICQTTDLKQNPDWVEMRLDLHPESDALQRIACTIKVIINTLWFIGYNRRSNPDYVENTPNSQPQLLTIEDIVFNPRKIMGAFGISVYILSPLAKWIASLDKTKHDGWGHCTHPEITGTMQNVAKLVRGAEWFERFPYTLTECNCQFSDYSGVTFNCYGDACDLGHGGVHNSNPNPRPYVIGPHNCDNFEQQFVLLAGVAKLCEVARREITKS